MELIAIPIASACTHSNVGKKVIEAIWGGINSCVRAVDADSLLSKSQESVLLGIALGDRFQGSKYDGICPRLALKQMLPVRN
jgi:hypothetical protein